MTVNFPSRLRRTRDRQECLSYSRAVAFLVLLPGAAWARIVAPDFCPDLHGFRRFRLCRAGLILQIFLLALLAALDFPRDGGQMLRLAGTRSRTGSNGIGTRTRRLLWRWRLLTLLNLDVVEITDRFVVNARHHVFEKDERFLLEFNKRIFLPVAAQPDALFQVVEREQVVFPL